MTHTNYRLSIIRPFTVRLVSIAVATAGMLGCTARTTPGAENEAVGSTAEAAAIAHEVIIHYTDDRVATHFQVSITGIDQSNGGFYGGNAFVPGPVTGGTDGQDFMLWSENGLSQEISAQTGQPAYDQNASWINIIDTSSQPHQFTTMRVEVHTVINGDCHYDWEDVDMSQGVDLDFNGYGAQLVGNCWVGDLLTHH